MKVFGRVLITTLLLTLLGASTLRAQDDQANPPSPTNQVDQGDQSNQVDPPGRAIRLQYTQGSVSIQPQGNGDWVEGALNRPLTNADNVWTDKNARAELSVGTGLLRLNSEASLTLTNINDNTVQVQLHQGTLNLNVRHLFEGEVYEVDTPNMAFTVQKNGEYRFDVDPDGDASSVTVWKGQGDATGDGPAVHVKEHEKARFTNGTSLSHQFAPAPGFDGFDDWARVRDKREGNVSARYVAPGVVGTEDLDEYGTWSEVPSYGPIWVPRHVDVGWAPYRDGHWVWVSPWGWTWVDDAPWGYAPFHYGRWVYTGGYWGWSPGPRFGRPIYAPALVTWFGGAGWGVGIGFGGGYGYGWCPLGFGEPYYPGYRYSRGYFGRVNISNTRIVNINNYYGRGGNNFRYANMNVHGGITAVNRETFVSGRPVGRSVINVSASQAERARLGGRIDLAPGRESRFGGAGRASSLPPQRSFARPVASRIAAPGRSQSGSFNRAAERPGVVNGRDQARSGGEANARGNGRFVPRPGATNPQGGGVRSDNRGGAANGGVNSARSVPRPSESNRGYQGQRGDARSGVRSERGQMSGQTPNARSNNERNVPRPTAGVRSNSEVNGSARSNQSVRSAPSAERNSSPRQGGGERSTPRPAEGASRGGERQGGQRNSSRPDGGHSSMSVPRPTGRVMSASSYYGSSSYGSNSQQSRGYQSSSRAYSGNSRETYGSNRSYGSNSYGQSARSYSQPSRSYSQPSYGASRSYGQSGGGYSQRSYSAGPRYSAPSGGGYRSSGSVARGGGSSHAYSGGGGGGGGRSSGSGRR